ncbi:NfeD family protein [Microbacterium gorillae]|uniref:NfeD family protein n=1 Tax=Microbacterium gorillae TaxID=1231063 RepID=UPI00058DA0D0|nr:NfeD family protein [Microbacterium gorillae]
MNIDVLLQFAWIGWLILIGLFLVIEMFTLEFTFLMLALGSVVGLIVSFLGGPAWLQLVAAAVAALLLILLLRPPLLRRLRRGGDETPSNVDALIGMRGVVVQTVDARSGQVKLANGDIWTARSHGFTLPPATPVVVATIRGATADVVPSDREGLIA